MFTINGTGTKLYGISHPDVNGNSYATLWITFLFFPLVPLKRYIIKRKVTSPRIFEFETIQKTPLNGKEILTTYFFGWIITPILWFWPMPFAVREVGEMIGYTNENAEGGLYYAIIAFAILWIIVFAWKWKDWEEKRGLPKAPSPTPD